MDKSSFSVSICVCLGVVKEHLLKFLVTMKDHNIIKSFLSTKIVFVSKKPKVTLGYDTQEVKPELRDLSVLVFSAEL